VLHSSIRHRIIVTEGRSAALHSRFFAMIRLSRFGLEELVVIAAIVAVVLILQRFRRR
jgi:hypothetical protein